MSHDVAAVRSVRGASRRKVSFQTSMEDLEGRVLLSGGHHYRAPHVLVHVRVVHRPPAHLARLMRGLRVNYAQTQAPIINVPINVQTTVNGGSATSTTSPSTATSSTPTTPTSTQATTSTSQSWHDLVSPST